MGKHIPRLEQGNRDDRFWQAYRCATKDAINWLHKRANEMTDPRARSILHSAAFSLGSGVQYPQHIKNHEVRSWTRQA